jgi:hypothetical protein
MDRDEEGHDAQGGEKGTKGQDHGWLVSEEGCTFCIITPERLVSAASGCADLLG